MTRSFCKKNFSQCLSGIFHCYATSNKFINFNENKFLNSIYWCGFKITQDIVTRYGWMDRPCSDDSIHKGMTLVCRPSWIRNRYFNPIYWCGIKKPLKLTLHVLGWKYLELRIPKIYHLLTLELFSLVYIWLKVGCGEGLAQ